MFTRIRTIRPGDAVGLMIVGAAVTLILSGTAVAITDASFTYSTTQMGRYTIAPQDLTLASNAGDPVYYLLQERLVTTEFSCFVTGLHLPKDARINNLQTWYRSGAHGDIHIWLYRLELATNAVSSVLSGKIVDDSNVHKSATHFPVSDRRVVNNNVYAYSLEFCQVGSDSFRGARLTYEYTSAGD